MREVVTSIGTGQLCIFLYQNAYTCKQLCQALFSQRLILWKSSKRHLKFKWADRWRRVKGEEEGLETRWLMGQRHTVAAEFMSQSKSEYWESGHHVTLTVLRIIWQCIMLEICHAKKMCLPSPAAEITTCGAVRSSSTPTLYEFFADESNTGALLAYSELAAAKTNDRKHQHAWIPQLFHLSDFHSIADPYHNFTHLISWSWKSDGLVE